MSYDPGINELQKGNKGFEQGRCKFGQNSFKGYLCPRFLKKPLILRDTTYKLQIFINGINKNLGVVKTDFTFVLRIRRSRSSKTRKQEVSKNFVKDQKVFCDQ